MTEMIYTGENIGHRILSKYFKIKIQNPNTLIPTEFQTNDRVYVSNKGFIDGYKFTEYTDFNETAGSLETYINKTAGYIRWNALCLALSRFGVFFMELDRLEDAKSIVEPSSIEFTFGYEQPESIIEFVSEEEYVEDDELVEKLRDGRVIFKGVKALEEIIAKTLIQDITSFGTVYDPTISTFSKNGFARGDGKAPVGFYDKMIKATKLFDSKEAVKAQITITPCNAPDGDITVYNGNTISK